MLNAVRLPENLDRKLCHLSSQTGKGKSYYIRKAIEHYLSNYEDQLIALARFKQKNHHVTLAEMEQRLGLDN